MTQVAASQQVPFRQGRAERARTDRGRIDAMTVKETQVSGRVLVDGAGEAAIDVPFAVVFSERPIFTFGGELDVNHTPEATNFPTVSAVVLSWDKVDDIDNVFDGRYKGARIAVVTTGKVDMKMWVHYSFQGRAMRNPGRALDQLDDEI